MNKYLSNKELEIFYEVRDKYKRYCKCGHYAYVSPKKGVAECTWCHNNIFIDKKHEFEYRLKENLLREKRKIK